VAERLPSWKDVAATLAHSLAEHAHCDRHPESDPYDGCPFCEDRDAYRLWERKAGIDPVDTTPVPTITVEVSVERAGGDRG
jgi:hypothetical protein